MTGPSSPYDFLAARIVEASEDAIICLSTDGLITSWNPGAERRYGYTAAEMLGQTMGALVAPESREAEERLVARALAGERFPARDTTRIRRGGRKMIVSLSLFPLVGDDGDIMGVAAIERDVTSQRALEAELLQAKRLEAAGRLAGGVAHEFNNINTAILGLIQLASKELPGNSPAHADLTEVTRLAMRGSQLSRHLLAFSGRQTSAPESVSPDHSLRSLEPLLRQLVSERVWLTLDLGAGDATVRVDVAQLELVLLELALNASEAVGDRGTITIATRRRDVDDGDMQAPHGVPSGRYVEISVSDSGPGLPPGSHSAAFDPFFTTKADRGHAGLGLAVVYGIARQFGGYTVLSNGALGGADARVFLPTETASAVATDMELSAGEAGADLTGTETVLIVEDEAPVREVLQRALEWQGYDVLVAMNGEDALDVAAGFSRPIHLVVSDVVMPQMDGRELFDRLRQWYPGIRFLFISGYTRGAIGEAELRTGHTGFLSKPFSMDQLTVEVRRLLDEPRVRVG